jgi:hypothetical protein
VVLPKSSLEQVSEFAFAKVIEVGWDSEQLPGVVSSPPSSPFPLLALEYLRDR